MNLERYPFVDIGDGLAYEFTSVGPKGAIKKVVIFDQVDVGSFNLAFGDQNKQTGQLDDIVISNNGDRNKILATVAAIAFLFFNNHSNANIYFSGSSPARTRLYQMSISTFWAELSETFDIQGLIMEHWEPFKKGKNYSSFWVKLKI